LREPPHHDGEVAPLHGHHLGDANPADQAVLAEARELVGREHLVENTAVRAVLRLQDPDYPAPLVRRPAVKATWERGHRRAYVEHAAQDAISAHALPEHPDQLHVAAVGLGLAEFEIR